MTEKKTSRLTILRSNRGVALVLAMFILALGSIIVVNLTYTTYIGSRLNLTTSRGVQAEYLLKSAVNVAAAIIKEDKTHEDSAQDNWGIFVPGIPIPAELLGLTDPGLRISLEINPEESKIPLQSLVSKGTSQVAKNWRDALVRLFRKFGFDDDGEEDQTGLFPAKHFDSQELVANLIDYMDIDQDSYDSHEDFPAGIESSFANDSPFPNQGISQTGELARIPGFTPTRVRKMMPFITAEPDVFRVNINVAPAEVLSALNEDIDDTAAKSVVDLRQSTPITLENKSEVLAPIIGQDVFSAIDGSMIKTNSESFQIIAKVDYGTSIYFARAMLRRSSPGQAPKIKSIELY